jgi:hypothetical protein
LPNRLREENFKIIESENGYIKPELVQLCTNTYLMALRVIIQDVKRQLAQNLQLSISELEVALYRMSLQNSAGFIYNWSPVVVLAQVA